MKNWKVFVALVLAAALMCSLFAACSKDSTGTNPGSQTSGKDNGETVTIKAYFYDFNSSGVDQGERIVKAVNEMTEPAIHVKADILFMGIGDFASKVQTSIAGGEQIDLLTASIMNNVGNLYQSGMLRDITDELNTYAPEALAVIGDEVAPYTYGGRIYGIPAHRNLLTSHWIIMNKGVLEEIGMLDKAQSMNKWSEFEEILAAVKDAKVSEGMYPTIANSNSVFQGGIFNSDELKTEEYDSLGDGVSAVYTDKEGNVSLLAENESWLHAAKLAADWNAKGYIYPDSIINTNLSGNDLVNQGVSFSLICNTEYGIETATNYSFPIVARQISEPLLRTNQLTMWGMAVPVTAEEPEAACKFINMLYTNADLMNLLVNGQEGTDYTLQDGQIVATEGGYHTGNFIFGNNLLLTPALGQGADFYQVVSQKMAAMESSPYLGFTIDKSELDLYISQLSAVNDQYRPSLNGGEFSDSLYNEYMGKLETAGVREYLEAVQGQLTSWLANK